MPEKRSKYDTDPLDPDFARQTEEMWDGGETRPVGSAPTGGVGGETRPVSPNDQARLNPEADAPTRRIDDAFTPSSYPSVFVPPAYQSPRPPAYQQQMPPQHFAQPAYAPPPQQQHYMLPTPDRNVAGLGISEKWVTALPYAPFYIGVVVSIIELLVVPRAEMRARFHAAQGLALQLGIIAISFALRMIGLVGGGNAGRIIFGIAAFVFLVYSFIRVLRGDEYRIAPLSDAVRWLDAKIDPKK
ncbi:MAG: hypothetical protein ACJ741_15765 [Pyrinomonadaceae bacterium]